MTDLKQCYKAFGGDYDGVLGRLRKEQTVQKFVFKFLDDKSFAQFEAAMEKGDYEEALRAVHTLKGVCQNLSFTRLYESSNGATAALKENDPAKAAALLPKVAEDYHLVVESVAAYKNAMEGSC